VLLISSNTTTSAITSTNRAMATVPRPIPDCTAAGGVAGTTVCTVAAGTVTTEATVVVATAPLERTDEGVVDAAAGGDWLVAGDDESTAELTVEPAGGGDDDLVGEEFEEATLLCWPLDNPVVDAVDCVPDGAASAGAGVADAVEPSPSRIAAAAMTVTSASKPAIVRSRSPFRRRRRTAITSSAVDVTASRFRVQYPTLWSKRCDRPRTCRAALPDVSPC